LKFYTSPKTFIPIPLQNKFLATPLKVQRKNQHPTFAARATKHMEENMDRLPTGGAKSARTLADERQQQSKKARSGA